MKCNDCHATLSFDHDLDYDSYLKRTSVDLENGYNTKLQIVLPSSLNVGTLGALLFVNCISL